MDEKVYIQLDGTIVELLVKIDPTLFKPSIPSLYYMLSSEKQYEGHFEQPFCSREN
jgi:hypothetical protein